MDFHGTIDLLLGDFEEVHCLLQLSQRDCFQLESIASFMGALFSSFVMEQLVINETCTM